tara:strand:- start:4098 stop:4799 length:702 start_codon:yes stop_codon:yes gene_type:complete
MNKKNLFLIFIIIIAIIIASVLFINQEGKEEPIIIDDRDEPENNEPENNPSLIMQTNRGNIKIELFKNSAPKTVANFLKLSKERFYNGTKFHRIIPQFMIQAGDPNSRDNNWADDGMGGPGYAFEDEINPWSLGLDEPAIAQLQAEGFIFNKELESHKLERGILAMANSGPNTNGSQFFIITAKETSWLNGRHTSFGKVLEGMAAVDAISILPKNSNDHPTIDIIINNIEIIK